MNKADWIMVILGIICIIQVSLFINEIRKVEFSRCWEVDIEETNDLLYKYHDKCSTACKEKGYSGGGIFGDDLCHCMNSSQPKEVIEEIEFPGEVCK